MTGQVQVGDVFFTSGTGWIYRLIAFFTRRPVWEGSRTSHVGVCVRGGPLEQARFVSATAAGVEEHGFWPSLTWRLYRPINLEAYDRQRLVWRAKAWEGRPYGFVSLLLFAADWVIGLGVFDVFLYRRLISPSDWPVCSTAGFVHDAFRAAAGKDFGMDDPRRVTPDDLEDFCREHDGRYYRRVAQVFS